MRGFPKRRRRKLAERDAWQAAREELKADEREAEGAIPSWFLPWAPEGAWLSPDLGWYWFYTLDHFLFGTIYPPILAGYLVIGLLYAWKTSPERRELAWLRARKKTPLGALLVGLDARLRPHYLTQADRNRHVLVSGTTGSGKSKALCLMVRNDIESGKGLIFIDMKGDREQSHAILEMATQAGRKDDFQFFSSDHTTPCHSYNTLASGDPIILTDRIIMAGKWSEEPYYKNVAKATLARVLPALMQPNRILTLDDVRLPVAEPLALEIAAAWAQPALREKMLADREHWDRHYKENAGLRHNLDEICRLEGRMCRGRHRFSRGLPPKPHRLYRAQRAKPRGALAGSLARLMLEDIKQLSGWLSSRPDMRRPFSLYVDEASFALYPGFVGFLTQCRSAGIGMVLATQSPLDFREKGDERVLLAITQNTNIKMFFCQRNAESADYCSKQAGTHDTIKRTTQVIDEGVLGGTRESGVYSEREVQEFIAHPGKLRALPRGRALFISGGDECEIIDVDYKPVEPQTPFEPVMPRKWESGDRKAFGLERPALNLSALVAEAKEKQKGELAKRKQEEETLEKAEPAKDEEQKGAPGEGGVVRKNRIKPPKKKSDPDSGPGSGSPAEAP